MLENCNNAKERWGGVNELIDKWLMERQTLIVKFYDISTNPGSSQENMAERLQTFCQLLVDYVSVGHFEIYDQLLSEADEFNNEQVKALAARVIPLIQETTEVALDFNDSFDDINKVDDGIAKMLDEMENLGTTLASRFELEDQMIAVMHKSQASQVNVAS